MEREIYYKTDFNLECPVNDYDAAREYLLEDDMTKYLIDSLRGDNVNEEEIMKIKNIKWILQDTQSGYILLTTTDVLPNNILSMISEWVSGQNSDGLGEGFEQQDFAEYDSGDYYDEDNYDDEYCMASFDWKTNKYPFKRVNSPYSLRENNKYKSNINHIKRLDEMNSRGKYSWHIFRATPERGNEEELYNSYNEGQDPIVDTPEEALRDAIRFINFYKNEFRRGLFSIEVYDEIDPDFVMGEELENGVLTDVNDLHLEFEN